MKHLTMALTKLNRPLIIGCILLLSACVSKEKEPVKPNEPVESFTYEFSKHQFQHSLTNTYIPYNFFKPKQSVANPTEKFPLIIALHGTEYLFSEQKDFLNIDYTAYMALAWIEEENQLKHPAYVVAPNLHRGLHLLDKIYFGWQTNASAHFVEELLDFLIANEQIDPARVYITGHSIGGLGTWHIGVKMHEKIAAIVPLSAAFSNNDDHYDFIETGLENGALQNVAVWGFIHRVDANGKENGVPGITDGSRALFKRMEELDYQPVYTHWVNQTEYGLSKEEIFQHVAANQRYFYTEYGVYPCQSVVNCHFIMGYALREDFLFDWLFQQRKD